MVFSLCSGSAYADQFDSQISDLNNQINASKAQLNQLSGQVDTLARQEAVLNGQISILTSQLRANQLKATQLQDQISALQAQIAEEKSILADNIRSTYQTGDITPIEILASSNSFSEYVDKQEYQQQIKSKLQDAMNAIVTQQTQLESQQTALATIIAQQQQQQIALNQQISDLNNLIAQTQNQESNYQKILSQQNQQLQGIIAARAAAVHSGNLQVSGGGCGPYPDRWCHAAQDSLVTDGRYYNRECVSYVAYRREGTGRVFPDGWGNASDWFVHVDHYSNPQPGDIIVWKAYGNAYVGGYGHVAYVEGVSSTGITISQYNFDYGAGEGLYSQMFLAYGSTMMSGYGYIH